MAEPKTALALYKPDHQGKRPEWQAFLTKLDSQARKLMAANYPPGRWLLLAERAIVHNSDLMECSILSIAASCLEAATKRLEIGGADAQAYLVPFKKRCQLMISYRGYNLLASRAGFRIDAHCVYAKDKFRIRYGSQPLIEHEPFISDGADRGVLRGAYAIASSPDGYQLQRFHDRQEIERRRQLSQARDGDAWKRFYDAMAMKGPIRDIGSKLIPHDIAPALVEAAVTDERRESGITAATDPELLAAASEVTGEPVSNELVNGDTMQTVEGIVKAVVVKGKTLTLTVDVGDEKTVDFVSQDLKLQPRLLQQFDTRVKVNYFEKAGKRSLQNCEAA